MGYTPETIRELQDAEVVGSENQRRSGRLVTAPGSHRRVLS